MIPSLNAAAPHVGLHQDAERRQLLQRIAASKTFHRSARLRDLLVDIGEQSLAGRGEELSEQAIGVRVFGRDQGYSAAEDNIVRASVRQVRLKLKEYYETEGHDETIFLEIPKGGYVAVFTPRTPPPEIEATPVGVRRPAPRQWRWIAAGTVALVVLVAWLLASPFGSRSRPEPSSLFSTLLASNNDPVRFVLTDSALVVMNEINRSVPSLEEYTSRSYVAKGTEALSPEIKHLWDFIAIRQITSLADVMILSRLYQDNPAAGQRVEVRYARHMQIRDFKSGNFIVTGSNRSNPWMTLFDSSLNFRFDFPALKIRNLTPLAGEPAMWGLRSDGVDYARIALLRNLSGKGFVLLIAGLQAEGTEGAGDFLLRPDSVQQIQKALGLGARDPIPPSEFILEVKTLQGSSRSATIIAARRR